MVIGSDDSWLVRPVWVYELHRHRQQNAGLAQVQQAACSVLHSVGLPVDAGCHALASAGHLCKKDVNVVDAEEGGRRLGQGLLHGMSNL